MSLVTHLQKKVTSENQAQAWFVRVCVCVTCVCVPVCFRVCGMHAWVRMCVLSFTPPAQVWQRWSVCMLRATEAKFKLQQPGRDAEAKSTEGLQYDTYTSQGVSVCILWLNYTLHLSGSCLAKTVMASFNDSVMSHF